MIASGLSAYTSAVMPKRRRGRLEEELRRAITIRVRGHRGQNKALAKFMDRPQSWVSEYMAGLNHANLDTSLGLMRYLGWSLSEDLGEVVTPADDDLAQAMNDPEIVRLAKRLSRAEPSVRQLAIQLATFAVGPSAATPATGRTAGRKSSPDRSTGSTRPHARRR